MKRVRKWLIRIGLGLLVLLIILTAVAAWVVRRAWPETSGTLQVSGLSAPVEISRDQWGVPHIYAQNEHDLFFGQGYVHAQDRLWQMEMNRRLGSGTLGEVLGRLGGRIDRAWRLYGLRRVAEQSWAQIDGDSRAILEAYAEGVNAYIDTHRDRLPVEFIILGVDPKPWTPVDTLVWGNLMAYFYSPHGWQELDYAKLVAKVGQTAAQKIVVPNETGTPIIMPAVTEHYDWLLSAKFTTEIALANQWAGGPRDSWGSNNWVVHGSRTATGKPLLANDIHTDLSMPSFWYENGLHGGRFDGVGFTFPGVPLILLGHNAQIAWGIAALRDDDQDFYIEKLNDRKTPTQYEYKGQWHDLTFVQEVIQVRGSTPITLEIPFTQHGPIVNMPDVAESSEAQPVAYSWTLFQSKATIDALVAMNLATDWDSFRAALRQWDTPGLNIVYADVAGNIGYQAIGKVPIRVAGHDGRLPVTGWTGQYDWQGFIPFDELPSLFNPPSGVIATANNKVVSEDYPYLISTMWSPGYRAKRITDLLLAKDRLTAQDMGAVQADTYLQPAEFLLPYLSVIEPQNDLQARALAHVKAWDRHHDLDSVGATVYEAWYMFLVKETIEDEVGENPPMTEEIFSRPTWVSDLSPDDKWFDDVRTEAVETRDEIVRRAWLDAVDYLGQQLGNNPDDWRWGRLHTVTLPHLPLGQSGIGLVESLFNSPTVPARGDFRTVNMGAYDWYGDPFDMIFGPSQRLIVDVGNWDGMQAINSTGQSGLLFHPQRLDQFQLWEDVQYRTVPFSPEQVKENAEAVLNLTP